jgi:D-alanyl-D-alanine carboxypeptidase
MSLSHHAWGAAIDLNARENPFGRRPEQSPRLVAIFAHAGLSWGGRWPEPDGMHFEDVRSPSRPKNG